MGINVDRTISLTFLLGGLLAGAAGLIYALYNGTVQFNQGFTAGLIAFTAAVMGGIGNLKGAVAGRPHHRHHPAIADTHFGPVWTPADRVRDPDPGDGLQARRACSARRRAKDERSSRRAPVGGHDTASRACAARPARSCCRAGPGSSIGLAAVVAWPYILDATADEPDDLLDASITTLAYIIMALGLNIVVGFAGLLDLGYVAFFAIGAFVMGWLGSQQFPDVTGGNGIHILTPAKSAFGTAVPASTSTSSSSSSSPALFTAVWGVILGAPTLRLRGDYLAIVTLAFGEIVPRIFENVDERHLRHRLHRLLQRPPGHHADRQDQPPLDRRASSNTRSSSTRSTSSAWRWCCW